MARLHGRNGTRAGRHSFTGCSYGGLGGQPLLKLLLDTHVWIWSLLEPQKLSRLARKELEDLKNQLWLSPISIWETIVLHRKGRIDLGPDPYVWIETALNKAPIREAPLNISVAVLSEKLALRWKDPADLFIAATAVVYDLVIISRDSHFQRRTDFHVIKA